MFDIQENLKKLPDRPGVYMHKDSLGEVIYVGKAVSLKNRVRQYFQSSRNRELKVRSMVKNISEFEYIITLDGNKNDISDAKDVLSKKGVTYKNIWFKSDSDAGKLVSELFSFPTTYVVDKNGNIVGEPIVGAITSPERRAALEGLIDQAIASSAK